MRPRKQVDLTNVEIDFTNVKTRSAHTLTSSSTSNTADAHSSVIASLLNADADNNEGGDNNSNKEQLILQAYDPAMQGYVNRHTQQAKGRRRHLFSSSSSPSSSSLQTQSTNTEITKATSIANEQSIANKSQIHIGNDNKDSSNNKDDNNTAIDFIKEVDSITNAAQEQQRLLIEYETKLKSFCQCNISGSVNRTSSHSESTLTHEQQQQNQQLLLEEEKEANTKISSSAFPACFRTTTSSTNNSSLLSRHSLISHLFADGVPDVEPWDRWALAIPRYGNEFIDERFKNVNKQHLVKSNVDNKNEKYSLNHIITPVLPESHYTLQYQFSQLHNMSNRHGVREMKTKAQLRAERRDRLKAKQLQKREEKLKLQAEQKEKKEQQQVLTTRDQTMFPLGTASSSSSSSSLVSSQLPHDRLSTKNLTLNLFTHSVLNPLATEKVVINQYEQRFLEHQRRNHERHVAAIPAQIAKRERDLIIHAEEHPLLRVYRVFPIYNPSHLSKIRHYANDNLLRGFVLWVNQIDALIVLSGGSVALRHLDKWIMNKMKWESELTRAWRVCMLPLMDARTFSFHLKPAVMQQMSAKTSIKKISSNSKDVDDGDNSKIDSTNISTSDREPVYMNFVDSIEDGVLFLQSLPANRTPWHDLSVFWRAAFMSSVV